MHLRERRARRFNLSIGFFVQAQIEENLVLVDTRRPSHQQ
jgi:hypothetical protein